MTKETEIKMQLLKNQRDYIIYLYKDAFIRPLKVFDIDTQTKFFNPLTNELTEVGIAFVSISLAMGFVKFMSEEEIKKKGVTK